MSKKKTNTEIKDREPIPADEYYETVVHTYIKDHQKVVDTDR